MSEPVITRALSERQLRDDGSDDTAFLNREGIPLLRDMRTAWNQRNGRDASSYRHAGGSGLEAWYIANAAVTGTTASTAVMTANRLYAVPFVAPARPASVDRLAFEVTALSAGNARMGVWDNTADNNLYPAALLVDGGAVSTGTTGVKSVTVDVPLIAGQLYWLSLVCSATPTVAVVPVGGYAGTILGIPSTFGGVDNTGVYVAFTYAALPSTFPASGAFLTSSPPALGFRLS